MHKYVKHSSLRYRLSRNIRTLVSYTEEKHTTIVQAKLWRSGGGGWLLKGDVHSRLPTNNVGCQRAVGRWNSWVCVSACTCVSEVRIWHPGVVVEYAQKQRGRSLSISNLWNLKAVQWFQMLCLILTGWPWAFLIEATRKGNKSNMKVSFVKLVLKTNTRQLHDSCFLFVLGAKLWEYLKKKN